LRQNVFHAKKWIFTPKNGFLRQKMHFYAKIFSVKKLSGVKYNRFFSAKNIGVKNLA